MEKVLSGVGIALRDASDSFRPLEDVIHDVAMRWGELNEVQRAQLSTAIAGTRQTTIFNALMQNYGDTLHYVETQENAAGLASERYAIYLESVEAAQNRLTASWERLWQKTIESGAITFFLDLASVMLTVTANAGGLTPILWGLVGALIMYNRQAIAMTLTNLGKSIMAMVVPTQAATIGMMGLDTATKSAGTTAIATGVAFNSMLGYIGLAIVAISAVVMAVNYASEQTSQRLQELSSEIAELNGEVGKGESEINKISELGKEYLSLKDNVSRTTAENKRFLEVQNELQGLVPELSVSYDEQGNAILENVNNLGELLRLKREEIDINKELLNQKVFDQMLLQIESYEKQKKGIESLLYFSKRYNSEQMVGDEVANQRLNVKDSFNEIQQNFLSLTDSQQKAILQMLRASDEGAQELADTLESLITKQTYFAGKAKDDIVEVKKAYLDLLETVKSISDVNKVLSDSLTKSKDGTLDFSDLEKLGQIYPDYLKALSLENGQLKLNSDLIREYAQVQYEAARATAVENNATEEQLAVLDAQHRAFQSSISFSKDFVNNFNSILQGTSESLTGTAKEEFDSLASSIYATNEQFKQGQIDVIEYFNILEQQLSSANFSEMFGENQAAAQSFFTGMVANSTSALQQMTSEFEAGEIGLLEYIDRLKEFSDILSVISDVVSVSGEQLGMTSEQIGGITSSIDGVIGSVSELLGMYELIDLTMAGMSQGLEFNSEQYIQWANLVSQAMASVGGTWYDAAGNALNGADAIFNYATSASGNMNVLVNQIVARVNGVIAKATSSAANFLRELSGAISTFKGEISFTPVNKGTTSFPFGVPGIFESQFYLPNIGLEIGAGTSFSGIADQINKLASGIESWGASNPISIDDFINPGGSGATSGAQKALSGLSNSAGGLANNLKDASNNAKDLKDNLKDAEKAAIDSLKAQLKGYKGIIDARKKMLDSMAEERDYQNQVEDKNKEILKIQNELATLQLDDSQEAQARRLQLQDELAQLEEDLDDIHFDYSIDQQKAALDAEYQAFESTIENAIRQVQGIQATNLQQFAQKLAVILNGVGSPSVPQFHDGGLVGEQFTMKSNEMFAKLLKGEVVTTPAEMDRFMKTTLPSLKEGSSSFSAGDINIDMPINVQGNLDKSVLPDLEKLMEQMISKINEQMLKRGYNRRADMYSI